MRCLNVRGDVFSFELQVLQEREGGGLLVTLKGGGKALLNG